ncbi:hypothetical protein [uncultured Prevotella sp.]|nr:hypothetical protein [uncultured Prevotella sp.]
MGRNRPGKETVVEVCPEQWQLVALFIVPHQDMRETDGLECPFGGFP